MPLPLRLTYRSGKGPLTVQLTGEGLALVGAAGVPRMDVAAHLWDALVTALALGELDLTPYLGAVEAGRRAMEARAALQARISGRRR